jgi:hypothetical protein
MTQTQKLFLLAIALMKLHVVEQLLFGIDELYELQAMVAAFVNWYGDPDRATVVLVGITVTMVLLLCSGFMARGLPRLLAVGFFGIEFMVESHHIVKTILHGTYFPGAMTAAALVVVGALVLTSGWREFQRERATVLADRWRLFAGV